ncbi:hypothetical protein Amir_3430 [Actinosynnema mirum DSM 43827]|uniref:Pentapeptide repeat protein n=2 Tax=Actinosynnema TaxID=40566 RepID=C6W9W0_ACTMD|nr:hypothetical protein Amir_3430 [Actinosynnema mirum DSM 43827]
MIHRMVLSWLPWVVAAALAAVAVARQVRMSEHDTLLDEHARRRTAPDRVSTPTAWRRVTRDVLDGAPRALDRLDAHVAQRPDRRQDAVDLLLICLRSGVARGLNAAWRTEVQDRLRAHLSPGPGFWPGMALRAAGATLVELDLSGCRPGSIDLTGAVFLGDARLRAMTVTGPATFAQARFLRHADLADTLFTADADLTGAVLTGNAVLRGVRVAGATSLAGARVSGRADLSGAELTGPADFTGARFGGRALFTGTTFGHDARFDRVWFRGRTDVTSALVGDTASFTDARFGRRVPR